MSAQLAEFAEFNVSSWAKALDDLTSYVYALDEASDTLLGRVENLEAVTKV